MTLAKIFRNHMVLQRGLPIRIFGEGSGAVTVTLAGRTGSADADGGWLIEFSPMEAGGPYTLTAESAGETVVISDVMVGEVLLCAGQSNMQFKMHEGITPPAEYSDDPMLRIFASQRPEKADKITPESGWVCCGKENVADWSALAYHMGVRLRRQLGCAVGMVVAVQGASAIQSWIDETLFAGTPLDLPESEWGYDRTHPVWKSWNGNGFLYHYTLEPLIPYTVGGVVWYQGESNSNPGEAPLYGDLLELMIADWRKKFRNESLPFVLVELADFSSSESWKMIQASQRAAQDMIPHVITVKCADICEVGEIHPPTKWKLAERIVETINKEWYQ